MKNQENGNAAAGNFEKDFEKIYILTCHDVYSYLERLTDFNEEKSRELLLETYLEAYRRRLVLPSAEKQSGWLKKIGNSIAESKQWTSKEMIEAACSAEKSQSEDGYSEPVHKFDETSLFLELEDRISEQEHGEDRLEGKSKAETVLRGILSLLLLVIAVFIILTGIQKAKSSVGELAEPFHRTMAAETENQNLENYVIVDGRAVFLSGIGQILYSVPVEDTELAVEQIQNPEIQKAEGWTYYLPCPTRSDTQLSDVDPDLYHKLFRMRADGEFIEIIAEEVNDYLLKDESIYVSQYGRIQRLDAGDTFDRQVPGIYAEIEQDELFLYDSLGRTLKTSSDGKIYYEDQVFTMYSNRVEDVQPVLREKGHISYYLKPEERPDAIYRNRNGHEEVYETRGKSIDSFCIINDWLYYSVCVKNSGKEKSEIYRKSLTREADAELMHETFEGRIFQLYYSKENNRIYGNYIPRSWESSYGVVAVITLQGQMGYLNDEEVRTQEETSGNDRIRFIMALDDQIYGYWEDCIWEPGEKPIAIWRKAVVLADDELIPLP